MGYAVVLVAHEVDWLPGTFTGKRISVDDASYLVPQVCRYTFFCK